MATNLPTSIKTVGELQARLAERGQAKRAAAKAASATVPSVPEKDPNEKGTVAVPVDPQSKPGPEKMPAALPTNKDITPTTTLDASKTVDGTEKVAARAKRIADSIKKLQFGKSATAAEITPTMPSDKANDNKDTTPGSGKPEHPHNSGIADPAAKSAEKGDMPAKMDPTAEKPPTPPKDSKGSMPPEVKNTDDGKTKEKEKMASDVNFAETAELDPSFAVKIASMILATEEGRAYATGVMEKAYGAAAATDLIKAACFMEAKAVEMLDAQQSGIAAAQAAWEQMSPEERGHIEKVASVHQTALVEFQTDFEKQAYDQGASDAAGMADQGMGGGDGGGMPPGMGAGGDPSGGAAGGAGGGQEISIEQIMQVLEQMVQSGELPMQEAQQIAQELMGGQGGDPSGGAGGGGMPPGMGQGDPGGAPEGAGMPGGDGSGGAPGKAAKSKPKKEKSDDDGNAKEASAPITVESFVKGAAAIADAAVEELLKATK